MASHLPRNEFVFFAFLSDNTPIENSKMISFSNLNPLRYANCPKQQIRQSRN